MKKCKTCKYWDYQGNKIGKCSGIVSSSIVIHIPNQPKEKPDGKLITKEGIITDANFIMTTQDWNCKNWELK
jgi:hypothetical protein